MHPRSRLLFEMAMQFNLRELKSLSFLIEPPTENAHSEVAIVTCKFSRGLLCRSRGANKLSKLKDLGAEGQCVNRLLNKAGHRIANCASPVWQ